MSDIQKPCAICGGECAGQPRTKDAKGRYYHQQCYDEALAKRKAKRQEQAETDAPPLEAPPVVPTEAAPPAAEESELVDPNVYVPQESDDPLMAELMALEQGSETAPPAEAPPRMTASCPACGRMLSPDAVLCVSCGYDLRSKKALTSEQGVDKGPSTGAAWALVIGIISIGWGALSLLPWVGMALIFALAGSLIVAAITLAIFGALPIWLIVGGSMLLRRRQRSAFHLKGWSIVSIILGLLVLGSTGFAMSSGATADAYQDMGIESPSSAQYILGMIVNAALLIGWPTFLLIWFSRRSVKQQMSNWG